MATSKAKRPVLLAQLTPQRHRLNPEQILRPKNGLRISPAGSQSPKTRLHARKAAQPTELMPVKTHAYRTLAELNGGFDKVIQELHALGRVSYFRPDRVTAMRELICQIRAQANRDFTLAMHEREKDNAGYFERGGS
jgi:hypothetical protein